MSFLGNGYARAGYICGGICGVGDGVDGWMDENMAGDEREGDSFI